jgi:DNA-directed RNA polymerase beta' subunit
LIESEKIFLKDREEEFWFGPFETVFGNDFRNYSAGITLTLNQKLLYKYKIKLTTIMKKINQVYEDVSVVISPFYIGQIDIFVDTSEIHEPTNESLPTYFKGKNHIKVYIEEVVRPKLLEIEICGLKGIKNFNYQLVENNWIIHTEGSNFLDLLTLPFVNISTASSNNMWEIYQIMGIEATREFLIEEFTNVVSSDGTFINSAHIILLVDIMTFQGIINSVSRYGMKKEQMGVLSRASFEESLDQFCNAGFYAEKDHIKAVSASIMCGKRSNIGSGLCNLSMDWEMIKNNN